MRSHFSLLLVVLLAAILSFASKFATASPPGEDPDADLIQKLAREQDLVKKAKIEIRLARLKLHRARYTRENGDVEASLSLLQAYHAHIENAWSHLQKSGRLAHKKPQGFKELDIALREDIRFLEDFKRGFSLADREPVEKTISEVERIRADVLKALFPGAQGATP